MPDEPLTPIEAAINKIVRGMLPGLTDLFKLMQEDKTLKYDPEYSDALGDMFSFLRRTLYKREVDNLLADIQKEEK